MTLNEVARKIADVAKALGMKPSIYIQPNFHPDPAGTEKCEFGCWVYDWKKTGETKVAYAEAITLDGLLSSIIGQLHGVTAKATDGEQIVEVDVEVQP
jgi:hypothetical protein